MNNQTYRLVHLMNTDTKILSKILADQIRQLIGKIIQNDQEKFIPGRVEG